MAAYKVELKIDNTAYDISQPAVHLKILLQRLFIFKICRDIKLWDDLRCQGMWEAHSKKAFISYAWEQDKVANEELQAWIRKLQSSLQDAGVDAFFDISHMTGNMANTMRSNIEEASIAIIIGTPTLAQRAANPETNVAFEIRTILERAQEGKIVVYPIVRSGTLRTALPESLFDYLIHDFTDDSRFENALIDVHPLGIIPAIWNFRAGDAGYEALLDLRKRTAATLATTPIQSPQSQLLYNELCDHGNMVNRMKMSAAASTSDCDSALSKIKEMLAGGPGVTAYHQYYGRTIMEAVLFYFEQGYGVDHPRTKEAKELLDKLRPVTAAMGAGLGQLASPAPAQQQPQMQAQQMQMQQLYAAALAQQAGAGTAGQQQLLQQQLLQQLLLQQQQQQQALAGGQPSLASAFGAGAAASPAVANGASPGMPGVQVMAVTMDQLAAMMQARAAVAPQSSPGIAAAPMLAGAALSPSLSASSPSSSLFGQLYGLQGPTPLADGSLVYVCHSPGATPIWYRPTQCEASAMKRWQWTPYDPATHQQTDPAAAPQWQSVDSDVVAGGAWKGARPTPLNIAVIQALHALDLRGSGVPLAPGASMASLQGMSEVSAQAVSAPAGVVASQSVSPDSTALTPAPQASPTHPQLTPGTTDASQPASSTAAGSPAKSQANPFTTMHLYLLEKAGSDKGRVCDFAELLRALKTQCTSAVVAEHLRTHADFHHHNVFKGNRYHKLRLDIAALSDAEVQACYQVYTQDVLVSAGLSQTDTDLRERIRSLISKE